MRVPDHPKPPEPHPDFIVHGHGYKDTYDGDEYAWKVDFGTLLVRQREGLQYVAAYATGTWTRVEVLTID